MFNKLENSEENIYNISHKKSFNPIRTFKKETIDIVFKFAYDMTFGKEGEHRDHRSGGQYGRKKGEIFINAFQGKLAECGVYNVFSKNKINMPKPDFETYELGKWDDADFKIGSIELSVKSTVSFGNLLLLETKDWNNKAEYLPNKKAYDRHILVRISPDGKGILRSQKILYSNDLDKDTLYNVILTENWEFELTGYIDKEDLIYIIENKFILPQNALLNGKTKMDAENYYVQSGDMKDIKILINELIGE